jgi:hypothetical protein
MRKEPWLVVAVVVFVLAGGAAFWWWQQQQPPPAAVPAEALPSRPVAPSPPVADTKPAIRHPIEAPAEAGGPPDPKTALVDLFGLPTVLSTFILDDFPRRFAATVDNLGRSSAPSGIWPVHRSPGQMLVDPAGGDAVIGTDNARRYTPFVLTVEAVDAAQAVAAYRRLYPMFQRAYEEIGYPGRHFNDRVVEVIDLLLATPATAAPPKVHLPVINGPVQPKRPWLLYQFDDPALESLAAGQKILLRMGPENERRMKSKLLEIRRLLVAPKAS